MLYMFEVVLISDNIIETYVPTGAVVGWRYRLCGFTYLKFSQNKSMATWLCYVA
jgi:hypothetical protein